MKGAKLLKVTGIIFIIAGAFVTIISIIALIGVAALIAAMGDPEMVAKSGLFYLAAVIGVVSGIVDLVAGIVGVTNCEKPEKAGVCLTMGGIIIALTVLSAIITLATGQGFNFLNFILGLILPGVYVYGAMLNKQSA